MAYREIAYEPDFGYATGVMPTAEMRKIRSRRASGAASDEEVRAAM